MRIYSLSRLTNPQVLSGLYKNASRSCEVTALLLAYIAEADKRRLYLSEGFPSMHAFCVARLHLSEPAAFKRIHAARAARKFPELFSAIADGRLHLSAVCMLAPHFTSKNVSVLMAEATHRRKFEIRELLARHF